MTQTRRRQGKKRERRTEQVSVRFTKTLMDSIRAEAERLGDSPAGHIRACVEAAHRRVMRPAVVFVAGRRVPLNEEVTE